MNKFKIFIALIYIGSAIISFFLIPDNSLFIFFVTIGSFYTSWILVTYGFDIFFVGICLLSSFLTFLLLSLLLFNYSNLYFFSFSLILYLVFVLFNSISLKIFNKNLEILGGTSSFRLNGNTSLIDLIFHIFIFGLLIIYAILKKKVFI